jgi:lysophospholipase L1-like esterase
MPRRTLRKKLLLAVVGAPALVAALLLLCELAFVVAGVDPRQHFFVRATDEQGRALLEASRDPPIPDVRFRVERFPASPPAGTRRIVCIGDSTCYGLPFEPPVPYADWIAARLKVLVPEVAVEVVNLGACGLSSEEMLDLLSETGGAGADVLLIYSGHNEFIDRNLEPVLHPIWHALRRALARSRAGSWLLRRMKRPARLGPTDAGDALDAIRATPTLTQEELARGRARYRDHLERMVALAREHGAAVFVIHPVSDYVETPVGASVFTATTPPAAREEFQKRLPQLRVRRRALEQSQRAGTTVDRTAVAPLLALVDGLARLDPGVSRLRFERGRLLLLEGEVEAARAELLAAREADDAPVRATAAVHAIQEEVAARGGALTVDPRPAFDAAAAPALPGRNGFFIDYCHPDVRGHELIADAVLRAFARAGLFAPESSWRFGAEPSCEEYLERGGYDAKAQAEAWARSALFKLGVAQFGGKDERSVSDAREIFERSLASDPQCATAWIGLGVVAAIHKEPDEAVANFERAAAAKPGALQEIERPYRLNPAVQQLFATAGLLFEHGRIVRVR